VSRCWPTLIVDSWLDLKHSRESFRIHKLCELLQSRSHLLLCVWGDASRAESEGWSIQLDGGGKPWLPLALQMPLSSEEPNENETASEASRAEEETEEEEDRKPPSARTPQLKALLSKAAPGILQNYSDILKSHILCLTSWHQGQSEAETNRNPNPRTSVHSTPRSLQYKSFNSVNKNTFLLKRKIINWLLWL